MPVLNDWNEYDRHFGSKNLVVNGEFPNNVGDWVVSESLGRVYWQDGRLFLESTDYWAKATQDIKVKSGKLYRFKANVDPGTNGGNIQLIDANRHYIETLTSENIDYTFVSPTSSVEVRLSAGFFKSGRCSFDNISLVEV